MAVIVLLVVGLGAAGWMLYQLGRAPGDRGLRVAVLLLVLIVANALVRAQAGEDPQWWSPDAVAVVLNVSALAGVCLLLCFLSLADPRTGRTYRWVQLGVLGAIGAAMAIMAVAIGDPADLAFATADMSRPLVVIFFVVGNVYFVVALALAARHALAGIPVMSARIRVGLRIAAAGLIVAALTMATRLVSVVLQSRGTATVLVDGLVGEVLLPLSVVLILVGMTYPGVATRWIALRRWRWHRRVLPRLGHLWEILDTTFPEATLERAPERAWTSRHVHRRCYRRIVECRDGLTRLAPRLAQRGVVDGTDDADAVARAVRDALGDHARGVPEPTGPALVVLPPRGPTLDDEIHALMRLSAALERIPPVADPVAATADVGARD